MLEEVLSRQGLELDARLHIAVNEAALIGGSVKRARGAKRTGRATAKRR